jgi:hypothetical protein
MLRVHCTLAFSRSRENVTQEIPPCPAFHPQEKQIPRAVPLGFCFASCSASPLRISQSTRPSISTRIFQPAHCLLISHSAVAHLPAHSTEPLLITLLIPLSPNCVHIKMCTNEYCCGCSWQLLWILHLLHRPIRHQSKTLCTCAGESIARNYRIVRGSYPNDDWESIASALGNPLQLLSKTQCVDHCISSASPLPGARARMLGLDGREGEAMTGGIPPDTQAKSPAVGGCPLIRRK